MITILSKYKSMRKLKGKVKKMNNVSVPVNVTLTWVGNNETLDQVNKLFNISIDITNLTNESNETQGVLFDLYEMYRTREKAQLSVYKFIAYVMGVLIILSNLIVVISSGLILKRGQQPKSTYLLLGNVSLADTIVGFSIIFGTAIDHTLNSSPMCVFQIGMLVCPAMVSIFSVGLIAVDRYIYIIHGLYYQRWFSTTRVRIGILCIWLIGLSLGFMPLTGWVNTELRWSKCSYIGIFPGSLILLNSLLSMIPIVIVAILYTIILVKAFSNLKSIRASKKCVQNFDNPTPKLRINRGNGEVNKTHSVKRFALANKNNISKLKKSASFDNHFENALSQSKDTNRKSKSIDDLPAENSLSHSNLSDTKQASEFSIITIASSTDQNSSPPKLQNSSPPKLNVASYDSNRKPKELKICRGVVIVMLTSGSFIVTWTPLFIVVIVFVFCEEKLTNPKCVNLRALLSGPVAVLAFLNSILNPLIYAWWHKGFQRTIKLYVSKYWRQYFSK